MENSAIKDIIKQSVVAKKELISYMKEKGLKPSDLRRNHPKHKTFINPRLDKCELAEKYVRQASIQAKTEKIVKNIIKPQAIKLDSSFKRKKFFKKHKKEKPELIIIDIPDTVIELDKEDQALYREIFTNHFNSGMPKQFAEQFALRDLYDILIERLFA